MNETEKEVMSVPAELEALSTAIGIAGEEAFALTGDMIYNGYPNYLIEASSAAWDRVVELRAQWNKEWAEFEEARDASNPGS